jgi:RIO kinase 1
MARLWDAGVSVPYPVAYADDLFYLEYIGARDCAAPQLARARLDRAGIEDAWRQLLDALHGMCGEGIAHADLSAFNLLWWDGRLVVIDLPQAVEVAVNPQGLGFLHRDVQNVCRWFGRRGIDCDPEEVFAQLLTSLPWQG